MFYAVKLKAPNTPSGNPNRGWLVYTQSGQLQEFVDEGYSGSGALEYAGYKTYQSDPAHLKPLTVLAEIPVASSVVNAARRGE